MVLSSFTLSVESTRAYSKPLIYRGPPLGVAITRAPHFGGRNYQGPRHNDLIPAPSLVKHRLPPVGEFTEIAEPLVEVRVSILAP